MHVCVYLKFYNSPKSNGIIFNVAIYSHHAGSNYFNIKTVKYTV